MSKLGKGAGIALRILFGGLFVYSGLNHFLHFWQPPAPLTDAGGHFLAGLGASAFVWPTLGAVFILAGGALVAGRFCALALAALAAPVYVIFAYHTLTDREPFSIGTVVFIAFLVLAWMHRRDFASLLRARPAGA